MPERQLRGRGLLRKHVHGNLHGLLAGKDRCDQWILPCCDRWNKSPRRLHRGCKRMRTRRNLRWRWGLPVSRHQCQLRSHLLHWPRNVYANRNVYATRPLQRGRNLRGWHSRPMPWQHALRLGHDLRHHLYREQHDWLPNWLQVRGHRADVRSRSDAVCWYLLSRRQWRR
jgi:hypothetical protein